MAISQENNDRLKEIQEEKVAQLKQMQMSTDQLAEMLYLRICSIFGEVYMYQGLQTIAVFADRGAYKIGMNSVSSNDLKAVIAAASDRELLLTYINRHKRFQSKPFIVEEQYIWNADGQINPLYNDWQKEMFEPKISMDLNTGKISVRQAYLKPTKTGNVEDFENLLKIIVGEESLHTVKMLLAQMIYEKRSPRSGRATLVLHGERGTGKNLLVEQIISKMLPTLSTPLPLNFQAFNGFMTNKFIYLDEAESKDINIFAVAKLAKRISGGIVETINQKYTAEYSCEVQGYFCVMSNNRPIVISERPRSPKDNQWIVVKMDTPLNDVPEFEELRSKYGHDLTKFISDSIPNYMVEVLLPLYQKMKEHYGSYRYGFPIPITAELIELYSLSSGNYEDELFKMFEQLENFSEEEIRNMISKREPNIEYAMKLYQMYKDRDLFSYYLFNVFAAMEDKVDSQKLRAAMIKHGIAGSETKVVKIDGKTIRCLQINRVRLLDMFEEGEYIDISNNEDDFIDKMNKII